MSGSLAASNVQAPTAGKSALMTGGGLWVVTPIVRAAVAGGELSIAVGIEQLEVAAVDCGAGGASGGKEAYHMNIRYENIL